jgi:hypothetical protein
MSCSSLFLVFVFYDADAASALVWVCDDFFGSVVFFEFFPVRVYADGWGGVVGYYVVEGDDSVV